MTPSLVRTTKAIIPSLLWTDWYKITMCQAVFFRYGRVNARYKFYDRGGLHFPEGFADRVREQVELMAELALTEPEVTFMQWRAGHYVTPTFLAWFRHFRFKPSQVEVTQVNNRFSLHIEGPWYETILWEVPLLLIISTLYHEMTGQKLDDAWFIRVSNKGQRLVHEGVSYIDFATRRAYSPEYHQAMLEAQIQASEVAQPGKGLIGTSNPYLAMKYGLTPYGTHAHEWFMVHGAINGYRMANRTALEAWEEVYGGYLGMYLYDTFGGKAGRDAFASERGRVLAHLFTGVRQDSGIPEREADAWFKLYRDLRIDPATKIFMPSNSLDDRAAISITRYCEGKFRCICGIGGWLGNGEGLVIVPNIVIKIDAVQEDGGEWLPCIKLSNDPGKATGDNFEIEIAQRALRLSA